MSFLASVTISEWIEVIATILALIYLYLEVKEKKALWLFGILSSAIYAYVYFDSHFYADFGLMVYYVIISIYGWIHWIKGSQSNSTPDLTICRITIRQTIKLAIITSIIYGVILLILLYLPQYIGLSESSFPYIDAFTSAASIVATWMLSQKILEQWYVWIVVNAICIFMYFAKDLNTTAFLFIIYTIGSVIGLRTWIKNFKATQIHV
jgi:nicotinamide mononucleotide transporter